MAKSLSLERIEERRMNLAFLRENAPLIDDDRLFTTTLIMQEEWLATVDELQGYVRDARSIRGLRLLKCRISGMMGGGDCTDFRASKNLYCAPCYLRTIHQGAAKEMGDIYGVPVLVEREANDKSRIVPDQLPDSRSRGTGEYCDAAMAEVRGANETVCNACQDILVHAVNCPAK